MQNRLLYLVQFVLTQVWQFLKLPFPGTDVPVGALIVMPTVVGFAVRFIRNISGVGGLGQSVSSVRSYHEFKSNKEN